MGYCGRSASLSSPISILLPNSTSRSLAADLGRAVLPLVNWEAESPQEGDVGLSLLFLFAPSNLQIPSIYAVGCTPGQHLQMATGKDDGLPRQAPLPCRPVEAGVKHFPRVDYEPRDS